MPACADYSYYCQFDRRRAFSPSTRSRWSRAAAAVVTCWSGGAGSQTEQHDDDDDKRPAILNNTKTATEAAASVSRMKYRGNNNRR
ncbi:hypothetical protein P280DRAFT_307081 [Massarina eburnea CBS 473.64]|uniref:Uncharacterized protein n=1 Tax=Massarina eburnea CBS 473.64 TaxID=1395130 RepID=A0A6A6S130_9PLEO|nr:hypothetical protein P280DRAFT_307081 [Massarina eburnea CBS 473.64]